MGLDIAFVFFQVPELLCSEPRIAVQLEVVQLRLRKPQHRRAQTPQ